jgi:hypothetical protein
MLILSFWACLFTFWVKLGVHHASLLFATRRKQREMVSVTWICQNHMANHIFANRMFFEICETVHKCILYKAHIFPQLCLQYDGLIYLAIKSNTSLFLKMSPSTLALGNFRHTASRSRSFQSLLMLSYLSLGLTLPFILPFRSHNQAKGRNNAVGVISLSSFARLWWTSGGLAIKKIAVFIWCSDHGFTFLILVRVLHPNLAHFYGLYIMGLVFTV